MQWAHSCLSQHVRSISCCGSKRPKQPIQFHQADWTQWTKKHDVDIILLPRPTWSLTFSILCFSQVALYAFFFHLQFAVLSKLACQIAPPSGSPCYSQRKQHVHISNHQIFLMKKLLGAALHEFCLAKWKKNTGLDFKDCRYVWWCVLKKKHA